MSSVTFASKIGGRDSQQDRVVAQPLSDSASDVWVLAVCDGHGGEEAAERCASLLPETVARFWEREARPGVEAVQAVFTELAAELAGVQKGGTTLSLAVVDESVGETCVGLVGDSPVAVRAANGDLWSPSRHHASDKARRDEAVARGAVFEKGYLFNRHEDGSADKARGAIILSRCLGSGEFKFMDHTPDVSTHVLGDESFVLVGTDGLLVNMERWSPSGFPAYVQRGVQEGWAASDFVDDALGVSDRDNVSAALWRAS